MWSAATTRCFPILSVGSAFSYRVSDVHCNRGENRGGTLPYHSVFFVLVGEGGWFMRLLDGLPGRRSRPARPLLSITRGGATWEAFAARSTGGVLRAGAAVRRAPSPGNGSSKAASRRAPRAEPPHTRQRRREPRSPRPRKPKQTRLLGHDCGGLLPTAHGSPESLSQSRQMDMSSSTFLYSYAQSASP